VAANDGETFFLILFVRENFGRENGRDSIDAKCQSKPKRKRTTIGYWRLVSGTNIIPCAYDQRGKVGGIKTPKGEKQPIQQRNHRSPRIMEMFH
jgi:hypothetical protein